MVTRIASTSEASSAGSLLNRRTCITHVITEQLFKAWPLFKSRGLFFSLAFLLCKALANLSPNLIERYNVLYLEYKRYN